MVQFRALQETDTEQIETLLHSLWGHDPSMLAAYSMHRIWPAGGFLRRSLVAVDGDALIAAATIFQSSFHPSYLYVIINVAHERQRQGIGSALLARLRSVAPGHGLMAKATQRDTAGMRFLRKHGFHIAVHSSTGLIDPQSPDAKRWLEGMPTSVDGFEIMPWDSDKGAVTRLDLARQHAAVYAGFHTWNPLAALSDQVVLARFGGEDVIEGSTLLVLRDGMLCGAASLIRNPFAASAQGEEASEAYLVNIGVTGVPEPQSNQLTAALIRRSIEWAGVNGYRVRFEADDTYQPHYTLFSAAPATEVDRDLVALLADG
jgi:GNAT superfamily N-acetyltransferase